MRPRTTRMSRLTDGAPSRPSAGRRPGRAIRLAAGLGATAVTVVVVAASCGSGDGSSAGTTVPAAPSASPTPTTPATPPASAATAGGAGAPMTANGAGAAPPAPPDGDVCAVVLAWSDGVVGTVNQFTRHSRDAADPEARRSLYLGAWDGLAAITPWLETAADRAPAGMQPALQAAAADVADELSDGRQSAVDLPDAAYEFRGVRNGKLFTTSEKSRIIVTRTLDNLRDELGEAVVPRGCGRQLEPVTLPVVTAP